MDAQIEEIKSRIDIVEFIGGFIEVKKAGRNFKACCPFHQEKTASFVISPDRQIWHCFGSCGDGGDIFKFLMKWERITFFEALKELADKAGVKLTTNQIVDQEWNTKDRILRMNRLAADFYHYILMKTSFGQTARDYLKKRGINEGMIKKFMLGYSPQSWDSLKNFLVKKGFDNAVQMEAGLLAGESGREYDRFRGRLMFPIFDTKENIIAFSGRLLNDDNKSAKYVNTPETPVYHKRESLFGIQLAKEAIRKANNAILVEGEFDMITPFMNGMENFVAIKGSAVTPDQLAILKRFTTKITLALDADAAGEEAIKRAIIEAEKLDFEIQIVQIAGGKDPDEAVRNDLISFKKSFQHPIPIYDFVISLAKNKYPEDTPYAKKGIADQVLPFFSAIQNPIILSHYVRALAELLKVDEKSIRDELRKKKTSKYQPAHRFVQKSVSQIPRSEMVQKYFIGSLLQSENIQIAFLSVKKMISAQDFSLPVVGKIFAEIEKYLAQETNFTIQDFFTNMPVELHSTAEESMLLTSGISENVDLNLSELAYDIKKSFLKHQLTELTKDPNQQDEHIKQLYNKLQDLDTLFKNIKVKKDSSSG